MQRPSVLNPASRPSRLIGPLIALLLLGGVAFLRLGLFRDMIIPVGFGVPIVLIAYFRSRPLLWISVVLFSIVALAKYLQVGTNPALLSPSVGAKMVEIDLVLVALMADVWMAGQLRLEKRASELEEANQQLSTREEEIAAQNEQLQSQTEELERQSEELRVNNEELERRERTLEVLLSLSRSLSTELSREDMMNRICQTVGVLVDGPSTAAAILEQDGKVQRVVCHHGFGPAGVADQLIPTHQSFASLVLSRGRTGYLEDISLRPDIIIPQPKVGQPHQSVLAVPLRVGGWPIGTLEVYSVRKTAWTDHQIALIESLAAQASISLEASHLFTTVQSERQRLESVLRVVPLALVISNADCSDIRINAAGGNLFNLPPDENIAIELGRGNYRLFVEGRELSVAQFPIVRAAKEGVETHRLELEHPTLDGKRQILLCNARPIRDSKNQIVGSVAALVDITPQKELQRELDVRRREAEEASVRKTRFLASVSHDVRTPANAISLLAELLRRSATTPAMIGEIPELAQELHASSISLVNLLTDVLDIARFDSGKVELQESDFSLGQLMEEEKSRLASLAREKGLTYEWELPPEPIWIRTDRIKMSRIIGNLVGNAIKFTERGEIRVSGLRSPDGGAQIRVKDTGVGIPQEHQRQIFDEFFQLRNPERDRMKGTGLGLSICSRLVDAMGAMLSLESEVHNGSTFIVTIPARLVLTVPGGSSAILHNGPQPPLP